jgi:FkbM family methyltransferase
MVELIPKGLRRIARRWIEKRGFIPASQGPANLHTVMHRRCPPEIQTVIDVGASDGRWSREMMGYYPSARYLLVEAQQAIHGPMLRQFQAEHRNVICEICAAGNKPGEINFDAGDPMGGQASATPYSRNNIVIPMETVDGLVRKHSLAGPFLLKLDTHGFEVPIFEGATNTLANSAMLIVEAYNFTLCPECLRFPELCTYLEARGFRCVDVFDILVRPRDQAFWQMDMVFIPASSPVFQVAEFC